MADSLTPVPDDDALWHSFTEGEEVAFKHLFTRYYPILYQYGRKFSPDTAFIKDAIQDLFTELWQRRAYLNHTPSVRNYLYKSLRRKMLRLSTSRPEGEELTDEVNQFNTTLSPEQLLLDSEFSDYQRQQMAHWLSFLTPRQREAIYLRFYHDMDYDEIATIMIISNHAARNLIYEALKLLRGRLLFIAVGIFTTLQTQF